MKRVSFKVAKAIKEVGYPQWSVEESDNSKYAYDCVGELWEIRYFDQHPQDYYTSPYYIEVWLWLWRKKQFDLSVCFPNANGKMWFCDNESVGYSFPDKANDPEEAIIASIEYLVDNNLIK